MQGEHTCHLLPPLHLAHHFFPAATLFCHLPPLTRQSRYWYPLHRQPRSPQHPPLLRRSARRPLPWASAPRAWSGQHPPQSTTPPPQSPECAHHPIYSAQQPPSQRQMYPMHPQPLYHETCPTLHPQTCASATSQLLTLLSNKTSPHSLQPHCHFLSAAASPPPRPNSAHSHFT